MSEKCHAHDNFIGGCQIFGRMCSGKPGLDCFCDSSEKVEETKEQYKGELEWLKRKSTMRVIEGVGE